LDTITLLGVFAAFATLAAPAAAQTYPSRPITMIVPFPPGGATDAIARILNDRLRQALGQTVIIENVGGAGGSIGVGRAVRAAPDGYTLNLGQLGSHVMNGAALTLPYDLLKDLDPVTIVAANPQVIVARTGVPASNLKELIAWLKTQDGKASVATVGAGSPSHVSAVYFANATGTKLNLVPYRGGGPAMQDLVGNQVDVMIIQVAEAVAQSQAGRLKAFAVTSKTRLPGAPDIPTVDEAGLPGMHISFWHGCGCRAACRRTFS
jgi:tripartite-type tricarboxylate transporter receptor subunit TctC